MNLIEYLKFATTYNAEIIKTLGGTQEIIKLVMKSPNSVNIAVIEGMIETEEESDAWESDAWESDIDESSDGEQESS